MQINKLGLTNNAYFVFDRITLRNSNAKHIVVTSADEFKYARSRIISLKIRYSTLEMAPIGCYETSVRIYHFRLRKFPEGRRARLHCGGSL